MSEKAWQQEWEASHSQEAEICLQDKYLCTGSREGYTEAEICI